MSARKVDNAVNNCRKANPKACALCDCGGDDASQAVVRKGYGQASDPTGYEKSTPADEP